MRRIKVMLTVITVFATLLAISAFPAVGEPGGKNCTDNPNGCKSTTGSTSTVESSTKNAGNSPGFNTTSTVQTTSTVKQRGNIGAGTEPTSSSTTTTIEGPCTNPGGQPQGGPCR
jgi:hypothetical protein